MSGVFKGVGYASVVGLALVANSIVMLNSMQLYAVFDDLVVESTTGMPISSNFIRVQVQIGDKNLCFCRLLFPIHAFKRSSE